MRGARGRSALGGSSCLEISTSVTTVDAGILSIRLTIADSGCGFECGSYRLLCESSEADLSPGGRFFVRLRDVRCSLTATASLASINSKRICRAVISPASIFNLV